MTTDTKQPLLDLDGAKFDLVGAIIAYEGGDLTKKETVAFFQHLVDTGLAWSFQGSYGRQAKRLIDAGLVKEAA